MVLTSSGNYATVDYDQDTILNSEDMRKLFVTKIPKNASDDDIKSFLEGKAGGSITDQLIVRKETAKNHFAFLTFETSQQVDEVIYKEKELQFQGSTLEVTRACPKAHYMTGAHHKTTKLFVAGIPKTGVTEEDLKQYFVNRHDPKYGTVSEIMFVKKKDDSGAKLEENKGFGFVTVSSEHLADTMSIQHANINLNGHRLQLKKSDRDGKPGQEGQRGGGRGGPRGAAQRGAGRGAGQYNSSGRGGGNQAGQYGSGGGYGGGYSGYGGYDSYSSGYGSGYDQSWGGYGYGYDSYSSSQQHYPQYGVSSAVARGRGGKDSRGGARGAARGGARGGAGAAARGGGRGGNRYAPYARKT